MSNEKVLHELIGIITNAIEMQTYEENFFLRSSVATSDNEAKALLSELANEISHCRKEFERKRRSLWDELNDLDARQKQKV